MISTRSIHSALFRLVSTNIFNFIPCSAFFYSSVLDCSFQSSSAMKGPIQYMLYCLLCLFPYHMSNPFQFFFPFFSFCSHSNSFCPVLPQTPWLEIISDHFVFRMFLKPIFTDACNLFSMFHSSFEGRF